MDGVRGTVLGWPPGVRLIGAWRQPLSPDLSATIAIPVRDEAARLGRCLRALSAQQGVQGCRYEVMVILNNCRDDSLAAALQAMTHLPYRLSVLVIELPPALAHVGWARRIAMNEAALRHLRSRSRRGVVLSTDADSSVAPSWLAATLRAIDAGADAVAGSILPDPVEARELSPQVRVRLREEQRYGRLLERLATLLDPEPHDPWPRHGYHCGASIAARVSTYLEVGGLLPEPVSEDRAFFAAILRRDGRIRHCPDVRVTTSCRLRGRAVGGMADTLSRWSEDAAPTDTIEAAYAAARSLWLRARLRDVHRDPVGLALQGEDLARRLGVPWSRLVPALEGRTFGAAYDQLLKRSPTLRGRRVPSRDLPREIGRARHLIRRLAARAAYVAPNRAGSDRSARP